jgi:hypothetical protein
MPVESTGDAGAWNRDLDVLKAVWPTGQGSDTDLPEALRFLRAVHRLTFYREREPDCELDRAAAMVLVPPSFFESPPSGTQRRPLLSNGNYPITGQIHFLNVSAGGHSLAYDGDQGALFDALAASQVAELPTIVYDPRANGRSKLSWYPGGIGEQSKVTVIPVAVEEPTVDQVIEAINGVYNGCLKTPDQVAPEFNPWQDADKGWAAEKAEARVQYAIKLGLSGRFHLCRIMAEQPGKDGRTDIEVVGDFGVGHGSVRHFAVLEIKVLREKGSTGKPYLASAIAAHINEGVSQASTYGDDRNFRDRLLCCFDMRASNAGAAVVFAPIEDKASKLGVQLGFWFLYRSSKHYRECQVAVKLTGG